MHETQRKIISLFKESDSELSTSQILEYIDESYNQLKNQLDKHNKEALKEAKRYMAKLHRRILHHLNNLVSLDLLRITRHGEKGEKFFSLNIDENIEISELSPSLRKRVIISRPAVPTLPIEGYEQKKLVLKYEPATWIDRLNSVVILGGNVKNLDELYKIIINNIFPIINDAICIENFEIFINNENVCSFIKRIGEEFEEYGKILNLSIELSKLKTKQNFNNLLEFIDKNTIKNIFFILNLELEDTQEPADSLQKFIRLCVKKRITLNIKNKRLQDGAYFLGNAGHYCIHNNDWESIGDIKRNLKCIACSQSTAIVDVGRFYNESGLDINLFKQLMFNISRSLLAANSLQRRKSEDYFKTIMYIEKPYHAEFLRLARNYIRFWNFGIAQPDLDPKLVYNMINEAKKKIDDFARIEEWVYKSCGMTTRFSVALSFAEKKLCDGLSPAKYKSVEIRGFEDLYRPTIKEMILERENICKIFDGGMDITFYRKGNMDINEILREIGIIMASYKLPFFSYNFHSREGDLTLTNYI